MTATTSTGLDQLAPWVEVRTDCRRDGSAYVVAVNHRHHKATMLESQELESLACGSETAPELVEHLHKEGFLPDPPAALEEVAARPPVAERVADHLRTLTVPWSGADRVVRRLHTAGLRHTFGRASVVAQLVLGLAGTVAIVRVMTSGTALMWRPEPWMVPLILGIDFVAIAVHELGHTLVLVHHGRSVHAAGFALHLGSPAFYVESIDGILLDRRQRVLQVIAGPWAEWLVTGAIALIALVVPHGALLIVLHRFVVLNSITVLTNLLPFVGLDGYWLLSDATREPMPADRGRDELGAVVRGERRGRGSVAWAGYAVVNSVVAVVLLVLSGVFWYQMFGGLLGRAVAAGPAGIGLATLAIALVVRPVLLAAGPVLHHACHRSGELVARVRFRAERHWRVQAIESIRDHEALAGFDEIALGVAAGKLRQLVDRVDFDGITARIGRTCVGLAAEDIGWIRQHRPATAA